MWNRLWWQRWWPVVLAWVAVMGGLVMVFNKILDHQAVPNRVEHLSGRTLELHRARDGHFRLEGRINGQVVRMLVDTGATGIGIDASLARKLGLPESGTQMEMTTANGVAQAYRVRLDEVRLGDISLRDLDASVSPDFGDPDEVLLGMNALKQLSLTMQGDTLRISVPEQ